MLSLQLSPQFWLELQCICVYVAHARQNGPWHNYCPLSVPHVFLSIDTGCPVAAGKSQDTI